MKTVLAKIPLREKKYARTKLAFAQALAESLEHKSLEDLSVKELCENTQLSEATFFNYFRKKSEVLAYIDQLWSIEMNWYGARAAETKPGLGVIDAVFGRAADKASAQPGLMGELISQQARSRDKPNHPEITIAERLIAYPELEDIATIPAGGLETILVPNIQQAVQLGELPENTLLPTVMVSLISIFYGVPLVLRQSNPASIGHMYRQQLSILWAGIRALA